MEPLTLRTVLTPAPVSALPQEPIVENIASHFLDRTVRTPAEEVLVSDHARDKETLQVSKRVSDTCKRSLIIECWW